MHAPLPQQSQCPGLSDLRRAAESLATLLTHTQRGAMEHCWAERMEGPAPHMAQQAGRGKDRMRAGGGGLGGRALRSTPCSERPDCRNQEQSDSPSSQLKGKTHRHRGTWDGPCPPLEPVHRGSQSVPQALYPLRSDSSIIPAARKLWPTHPSTSAPRLCRTVP